MKSPGIFVITGIAKHLINNKNPGTKCERAEFRKPVYSNFTAHETGQHLKAISARLDANPEILELAGAELIGDTTKATVRKGMSVDSIVRAALLKQMMGLSYEELAFYLADSFSYSSFARVPTPVPSSVLQTNVGRLSASCWKQMNGRVLSCAAAQGLEKGRVVRIDSTVTETDVHPPSDSALLWDCVRVMVRLMGQLKAVLEPGLFRFRDRSRSAKKRAYRIDYARGANKTALYKQLLEVVEYTRTDLSKGLSQHSGVQQQHLHYSKLDEQGWRIMALAERVIDQTRRRVLDNEKVAAKEKVLSIFEPQYGSDC